MVQKRIKIEDLLNDADRIGEQTVSEHTVTRSRVVPVGGPSIFSTTAVASDSAHVTGVTNNYKSLEASPKGMGYQYGSGLSSSSSRLLSSTDRGAILPLPLPIASASVTPRLPSLSLKSEQSLLMGANALSALSASSSASSTVVPSLPRSPQPNTFSPILGGARSKIGGESKSCTSIIPTPSASVSNGSMPYKINKPQGRPIIQSIIGKFTMYANIQDLILDITRFDRITLKDALNCSTEPFELIRYSKDEIQNPHKSVGGGRSPFDVNGYTSNIATQKNLVINEARVYEKLRSEFTCSHLKFIKIIRDKKGKLIRLESVITPNTSEITIDFIKKKICYPRYKSNMKIYLIKCDSPEDFENKFIYIHDNVNPSDMNGTLDIVKLDQGQEHFKNLTVWCRNE